jgi:hypothetical protein
MAWRPTDEDESALVRGSRRADCKAAWQAAAGWLTRLRRLTFNRVPQTTKSVSGLGRPAVSGESGATISRYATLKVQAARRLDTIFSPETCNGRFKDQGRARHFP